MASSNDVLAPLLARAPRLARLLPKLPRARQASQSNTQQALAGEGRPGTGGIGDKCVRIWGREFVSQNGNRLKRPVRASEDCFVHPGSQMPLEAL